MRKSIYTYAMLLALPVVALMTSCEPSALTAEQVLINAESVAELTADGKIYNINTLLAEPFMTEQGNFKSDSSLYRSRSTYGSMQLFSIDTLPVNGPGIYIRGRIATDDYGGNFYKALVIQQVNNWENGGEALDEQQCLRISVDLGSANGMYAQGQEILIRCNGLAIGRYANQPQLCVPSYNNNVYANSAEEKTGWAPGRISSARFRIATHMIGVPDKSKLVYETMTLDQMKTEYISHYSDVKSARIYDGRLIKVTGVHFTGEYGKLESGKTVPTMCNRYNPDSVSYGNPELDENAYTFGPTTKNVGRPQSRYIANDGNAVRTLVSTSEYARYAYYYLPATKYVGSVTGVLSYYFDNGKYSPDESKWAITPCSMADILPECQKENADPRWTPTEWKLGTPQPED